MSGDCGSRKRSPADAFVASIGLSDAPPCAPAKRGPGRPEGPRSQRQPKPACSEGADKRAAKALVLGLDYEYKQVATRKLWLNQCSGVDAFPGKADFAQIQAPYAACRVLAPAASSTCRPGTCVKIFLGPKAPKRTPSLKFQVASTTADRPGRNVDAAGMIG